MFFGFFFLSHFIVISGIFHVSNFFLIRHENKWENVLYFILLLVLLFKQLKLGVLYRLWDTEREMRDRGEKTKPGS